MTQKDMAALFGVSLSSVSCHLKNIFESNELDESVVIAEIAITTQHGALANKTQSSTVKLYNLDAIIAVGYRVNIIHPTSIYPFSLYLLNASFVLFLSVEYFSLEQVNLPA